MEINNIINDAVENEPPRSEIPEWVEGFDDLGNGEKKESKKADDRGNFEVRGEFLIESIIAYMNGKINMDAKEKEAVEAYFDRVCKHFDLITYIGGVKGALIAGALLSMKLFFKRFNSNKNRQNGTTKSIQGIYTTEE